MPQSTSSDEHLTYPKTNAQLVELMHEKFGIMPTGENCHSTMLFRITALVEEISELISAYQKRDPVEELDAVVDLLVFAYGTGIQLGFTASQIDRAFLRVMGANLAKEVGAGKRGFGVDLIKPPGWTPPYLDDIANERGDL